MSSGVLTPILSSRCLLVAVVVQRAKKCLDFTATIYFYHTLLCWAFFSFPTNWEWWVVNVFSLITTVVVSEFLCIRKEMQDIPRGSSLSPNNSRGQSPLPV